MHAARFIIYLFYKSRWKRWRSIEDEVLHFKSFLSKWVGILPYIIIILVHLVIYTPPSKGRGSQGPLLGPSQRASANQWECTPGPGLVYGSLFFAATFKKLLCIQTEYTGVIQNNFQWVKSFCVNYDKIFERIFE